MFTFLAYEIRRNESDEHDSCYRTMGKLTFKGLVIVTVSMVVIGADILTVPGANLRLKFSISILLKHQRRKKKKSNKQDSNNQKNQMQSQCDDWN